MLIRKLRSILFIAIAPVLGTVLGVTSASALTVTFVSATFQNSVTEGSGSTLNTTAVVPAGDAYLNWGEGQANAQDQSGYVFQGEPSIVLGTVSTPFDIGDFIHRNNVVNAGDSLVSTQLVVFYDLDLDDDTIVDVSSNLLWDIGHNETPNNTEPCPGGDTVPCGDIVTFTTAALSDTVEIDGVDYFFTVFGFSSDGISFTSSFFSDESADNSTQVWAQFNETIPVPEPATGALLLLALAGLGVTSRRR